MGYYVRILPRTILWLVATFILLVMYMAIRPFSDRRRPLTGQNSRLPLSGPPPDSPVLCHYPQMGADLGVSCLMVARGDEVSVEYCLPRGSGLPRTQDTLCPRCAAQVIPGRISPSAAPASPAARPTPPLPPRRRVEVQPIREEANVSRVGPPAPEPGSMQEDPSPFLHSNGWHLVIVLLHGVPQLLLLEIFGDSSCSPLDLLTPCSSPTRQTGAFLLIPPALTVVFGLAVALWTNRSGFWVALGLLYRLVASLFASVNGGTSGSGLEALVWMLVA